MPCDDFDDSLRRLQNNDPSLNSLRVIHFSHPNPADWETLGNAVASNSSLKWIIFYNHDEEPNAINDRHFDLLCEGLVRNTSINTVGFLGVEIMSTFSCLFRCLAPFLMKREVENIILRTCYLDLSSCILVGRVLAKCTFLREIKIVNCHFDEETSAEIIKSFKGMASLESIVIFFGGVWTGWDYLTNHLRFYNHTLKSVKYDGELPRDLNTLLDMNDTEDKNALAIRKGDAKPYNDMEEELKPKLLPHVLATVGGGRNGDVRSEEHRRSALFHCIKNMAAELNPNRI